MNIMQGPLEQPDVSAIAQHLVWLGYFPLPLNGKSPLGVGWQSRVNPFEIPFQPQHNIGIRTGSLLGLDLDIEEQVVADAIEARVLKRFGWAPVRFGRYPRRMIVVRVEGDAKSSDLRYERGDTTYVIQLIGKGRQFVGYGIHPDTLQPFRWQGPSLLDVSFDQIVLVDIEAVKDELDAAMGEMGFRRRFTVARNGSGNASLPNGLTLAEYGALARWGQAEVDRTLRELEGMSAGTGRGGVAHALGLRIGPLVTDGLLSAESIIAGIWAATQDDNAANWSFGRGVERSEGETVALEIETLRRSGKAVAEATALGIPMPGFNVDGLGQGETESGSSRERIRGEGSEGLYEALRDRAAALGSRNRSKSTTKDRVDFARLCTALVRRGALEQQRSNELAVFAKAYKPSETADGTNPCWPTPETEKLAEAVLETAARGADLISALSLGEAIIRPPPIVAGGPPIKLLGGVWPSTDDTFATISTRIAKVAKGGSVYFVHREDDGGDTFMDETNIRLFYSHVHVGNLDGGRQLAVAWWLQHKACETKRGVFKVYGELKNDEYNFWKGFGVRRDAGRDKIKKFVRHLRRVVCKKDHNKTKYLWRWLAWAIQNPDKNPETVVVIRGTEGAGKSTISDAMRVIFGKHSALVEKPEDLLGKHNDNLEYACFAQLEEALFAGDPKQADTMRSRITSPVIRIEPKHRKAFETPNMMHCILTTNHPWAVQAGENARRWFVVRSSDEFVGPQSWGYWQALYSDLRSGGYEQLLDALLETDLGDWHPRQMVKTDETLEQQELSADSVVQWLRSAVEDGGIEYVSPISGMASLLALGSPWHSSTLHAAYCTHVKQTGARPLSRRAFTGRLEDVIGSRNRLAHALEGNVDRRGFFIPGREALDAMTKAK